MDISKNYIEAVKAIKEAILHGLFESRPYHHRGVLPNNFAQILPDAKQALKAVCSFKDAYLLDFINVEELDEREGDIDEKLVEKAIVANVRSLS